MSRDSDRQKLSLFDPLVDNRVEGDGAASDAGNADEGERRPDAVPFFRHR